MTLVNVYFHREVFDVHHLNMKKQDYLILSRVWRPIIYSLREWRKGRHECKKKYVLVRASKTVGLFQTQIDPFSLLVNCTNSLAPHTVCTAFEAT
jgi:hypothetical protein